MRERGITNAVQLALSHSRRLSKTPFPELEKLQIHSHLPITAHAKSFFKRFPFNIVYEIRQTEIVIVAVAHHKRRPGYWSQRAMS